MKRDWKTQMLAVLICMTVLSAGLLRTAVRAAEGWPVLQPEEVVSSSAAAGSEDPGAAGGPEAGTEPEREGPVSEPEEGGASSGDDVSGDSAQYDPEADPEREDGQPGAGSGTELSAEKAGTDRSSAEREADTNAGKTGSGAAAGGYGTGKSSRKTAGITRTEDDRAEEESEAETGEDREDVTPADGRDAAEEYVLAHADPAMTGTGDIVPVSYMTVKQTLFDAAYVRAGDTIDSILRRGSLQEKSDKFLMMLPACVLLYQIGPDSPYLVAYANTMQQDANARVQDVLFAENDLNGTAVAGCVYDAAAGLAYIPKAACMDGETMLLDKVQMQLMQVVSGWYGGESSVTVSIADRKQEETHRDADRVLSFQTTVQAVPDEQIGEVGQDELTVRMNGIPLDDEEFTFDGNTGEVTIPQSSAAVGTVSVEIRRESVLEKAAELFLPVEVKAAAAASDFRFIPQTKDVELPADVVKGTKVTGTLRGWYGLQPAGAHAIYGYSSPELDFNAQGQVLADQIWSGGSGLLYDVREYDSSQTFKINLKDSTLKTEGGNELDLSAVRDDLILKCSHITNPIDAGGGPEGNGNHFVGNGSWGTMQGAARVLDMDLTQNWAIIGIMTWENYSQTGYGMFKVRVKPMGSTVKLQKRSADWIPLEWQQHLQKYGDQAWASEGTGRQSSARVESFRIRKPASVKESGDIEYRAHVQTVGWQDWVRNGAMAGTEGQGKRIEAVCVRLTGELAQAYDVLYTVHTSLGDERWLSAMNGEPAGTTGESLGIIDISDIVLIPKNSFLSLEGAEYTVYADADLHTEVTKIRTDAYGTAAWGVIEETGKFYVKETRAPEGYELDEEVYEVELNEMGVTAGVVSVENHGAQVAVKKVSSCPAVEGKNRYYDLTGTRIGIYASEEDAAAGRDRIALFLIGAGGAGKTEAGETSVRLDRGRYWYRELQTGKGYLPDREPHAFSVTAEDIRKGEKTLEVTNEPGKGGLSVRKRDAQEQRERPQGDASLKGAVFEVINDGPDLVTDREGKAKKQGEVVLTITTDEEGRAATGSRDLLYGDYLVREKTAPAGYLHAGILEQKVQVRGNGVVVEAEAPIENSVIRGGVVVEKQDKELEKGEALGAGDLSGISFAVINRSPEAVFCGGAWCRPGEAAAVLCTDEEGKAATGDRDLPYGTYALQELPSDARGSANDAYLVSDTEERLFTVREDGVLVTQDAEGEALVFRDQVRRGGLRFRKVGEEDEALGAIPFLLTHTATGEQHVIVTDRNGIWDSEAHPHERDTNGNDALLETYREQDGADTASLDLRAGVWFGTGQQGSTAGPDDALAALPYGDYILDELRCENNGGRVLIKGYAVTVDEDITESGVLDLNDLHNKREEPELQTQALDARTGTQEMAPDTEAKVVDTVALTGLEPGKVYLLDAVLMDGEEERTVRVPAENRTFRTVRGSTAFRAESADMEKEVEIPLDASSLAGRTVVVYERLYEVTEEGRKGRLAASHEEIDSPEQTVRISEPPVEPEPTPAPAVTQEPGTDKKTPAKPSVRTASPGMIRTGSARTGDSSHAVRWLLLLAAAVSVSGLLLRKRFRKEA